MPEALPADGAFGDGGVKVDRGVGVSPELLKGKGPGFGFRRDVVVVFVGAAESG